MEPRIQYAQTKDGVSIAYWTLGHGMPLLLVSRATGLPQRNVTKPQEDANG